MNGRQDESLSPIEIPLESISADALAGIIDNFILREGTDYGGVEASHKTKVEQILKQIQRSDVRIVFDPNNESVSLVTQLEWQHFAGQA